MHTLIVSDLVGENVITIEDGKIVYDKLFPFLKMRQPVCLDFSGVSIFASPFFNTAIGRLYKDFSSEELNSLLFFQNISPHGNAVLSRVLENSKKYYSSSETERDEWNSIVTRQGEE